tara:strand:+ start:854 stop:1165 length:312 start_codon:yes stop_codon:yes gene_type:complete
MNTQLTDCLTIVASHFGRVASIGLPSADKERYLFSFVDDRLANYVCSVMYQDEKITVNIHLDYVIIFGIDGNAKDTKNSLAVQTKLYTLGGELMAAGYDVTYS